METITSVDEFNSSVNYCYMKTITDNHIKTRPIFSVFTTCYNSYDKIVRAYNSIKLQTLRDWEWVIMDDSPDDDHFIFLKKIFQEERKVRLYKRSENSGSIGNVKNEAVLLCRGKYVLELDHDDEILPDVLFDAANVFEKTEDIGFIYMDYTNIYENGENYKYGDFFSLGYAGYYRQKYNDKWIFVASTPNINNITLSHIVSVPNHPRIWRKSTLLSMGNYSEFLPISDDYELLLRTAANTKMAKIHKLGYVQYMNNNNNNFSLIRNSEINRLCTHLTFHCYETYKIKEVMMKKGGYDENADISKQIWKHKDYQPRYCNDVINVNYKKQYCIIGLETLCTHYFELNKIYEDTTNDFLLLDNKYTSDDDILCSSLDNLSLNRMKCYSMKDCSDEELVNYFHFIYKSASEVYIITRNSDHLTCIIVQGDEK
jgi:glycosyltransferase involved in cell wall biosynthesis